jgi:hypothetical protein
MTGSDNQQAFKLLEDDTLPFAKSTSYTLIASVNPMHNRSTYIDEMTRLWVAPYVEKSDTLNHRVELSSDKRKLALALEFMNICADVHSRQIFS